MIVVPENKPKHFTAMTSEDMLAQKAAAVVSEVTNIATAACFNVAWMKLKNEKVRACRFRWTQCFDIHKEKRKEVYDRRNVMHCKIFFQIFLNFFFMIEVHGTVSFGISICFLQRNTVSKPQEYINLSNNLIIQRQDIKTLSFWQLSLFFSIGQKTYP